MNEPWTSGSLLWASSKALEGGGLSNFLIFLFFILKGGPWPFTVQGSTKSGSLSDLVPLSRPVGLAYVHSFCSSILMNVNLSNRTELAQKQRTTYKGYCSIFKILKIMTVWFFSSLGEKLKNYGTTTFWI